MSIFVTVERFGAPKRIYRSRAFAVHVGEDINGQLSFSQTIRPFFSLYAFGPRYLCQLEDSLMTFSDMPAGSDDRRALLDDKITLSGRDYLFTLVLTSASSELHSQYEELPATALELGKENNCFPQIKVHYAGTWRSFPIFENMELALSSNPSNAVFIEGSESTPRQCTIRRRQNSIEIEPRDGSVVLDGATVAGACSISTDGTLLLEPSGLRVDIHFQ